VAVRKLGFGRIAYGALFVVVIPLGFICWARVTREAVPLPVPPFPWAGIPVGIFGLGLVAAGMQALVVHGKGLPMNAYPPPLYVAEGVYRFMAHPIYVGFVLLCAGTATATGSASGLWLVTPTAALGATALVAGYERRDLLRRFGRERVRKPLLSLPSAGSGPPTGWDRFSIYVLVFLPWAIAFEAVYLLGIPPDAIDARLAFERQWPVLESTEAIYASVYVFVLITPLVIRTRGSLRRLATEGLLATAVVTLIYLTVPLVAPPRFFVPRTFLGHALVFERSMANTVAAFPAFHVIWSLIAAEAWSRRSRPWGRVGWSWAALITVSCITTGMHALVDILAALVAYVAVRNAPRLWELLRRLAEKVANSWREWRIGSIRLINHGFYAAAAAAFGFWFAGTAGGPALLWPLVFIQFCVLLGAGLWAQKLEGSSRLSRPFGYYGGAVGAVAGCLIAGWYDGGTMRLFALLALVAPWVQAIGRLRCLVQGCCHGAEAPAAVGIAYWRSQSRVTALAGLRGVPLHPTPLYSIIANAVIGTLLLRLWVLGAAFGLIAGAYMILAGAARFVEESRRGEPQTPILWRLRLYQWAAVASFALGMVLTAVPGGSAPGLVFSFDIRVFTVGAVLGLITGCAMGVDFPDSDRRFARLGPPPGHDRPRAASRD